jgi:hypothetical protein
VKTLRTNAIRVLSVIDRLEPSELLQGECHLNEAGPQSLQHRPCPGSRSRQTYRVTVVSRGSRAWPATRARLPRRRWRVNLSCFANRRAPGRASCAGLERRRRWTAGARNGPCNRRQRRHAGCSISLRQEMDCADRRLANDREPHRCSSLRA